MNWTHYTYLSGPDGLRVPTRLLDLTNVRPCIRRSLIHSLLDNGELLAAVPFGIPVITMLDLRKALDWLHRN